MAKEQSFFEESKEQSRVKSAIVAKYFDAWAQIMIATQNLYRKNQDNRIAYIDLFAGPGRYADGTKSTPLLVLEKAIGHDVMRDRLVAIFNDKDEENTNSLQEAIDALPGVDRLKYRPQVSTHEVGEEIVKMFEQMKLVPTLFFVDPSLGRSEGSTLKGSTGSSSAASLVLGRGRWIQNGRAVSATNAWRQRSPSSSSNGAGSTRRGRDGFLKAERGSRCPLPCTQPFLQLGEIPARRRLTRSTSSVNCTLLR